LVKGDLAPFPWEFPFFIKEGVKGRFEDA